MELFKVSLQGFRRFHQQSSLRCNGRVIALIGPNEAGKSSILAALQRLNDDDPVAPEDITRGADPDNLEIIAQFLLDDDELAEARLPFPTWMSVHKGCDGERGYSFYPEPPERDVKHRQKIITSIEKLLGSQKRLSIIDGHDPGLAKLLRSLAGDLSVAPATLNKKIADKINSVIGILSEAHDLLESQIQVKSILQSLQIINELESAPDPETHAINVLYESVPTFLLFDQAARQLESTYTISDIRESVPSALAALFEAADLQFASVLAAIDANDAAELTTLERRANRNLQAAFREAWRQSGISVALRLGASLIEVQVVNQDERYTRLAERSDGLRYFVALHAFASQSHADQPILLIDEAEQRLHYDAQADLVQMLTRQKVASKVLFTTHSAGCLPEDLGHGVRLVRPESDASSTSLINNKFWAATGGGISPLLFGLGATTLAFFPTRRAVCVEGPVDMLLYPIMFREVMEKSSLGFQFVPGLSSMARTLIPIVPAEAGSVGFLVDGDTGGRAILRELTKGGVPTDRIVMLENSGRQALQIEDFVDAALLLEAANAIISRYYPGKAILHKASAPSRHRMASLRAAFSASTGREIDKVALAYEILDLIDASPRRRILDEKRRADFAAIATKVSGLFE